MLLFSGYPVKFLHAASDWNEFEMVMSANDSIFKTH